jgi:uncharacterized damage-inducible protein DinB
MNCWHNFWPFLAQFFSLLFGGSARFPAQTLICYICVNPIGRVPLIENTMTLDVPLTQIFDGWNGYQTSLVRAIAPSTREQLAWRASDRVRSLGELALHICEGRAGWFTNMGAPGSVELGEHLAALSIMGAAESAEALVKRLELTWAMIDRTLREWKVSDLSKTYRHEWDGKIWANSRQWTIWRIMAHDIHHGGQIARILAEQDIQAFELRDLGGHIITPQLDGRSSP